MLCLFCRYEKTSSPIWWPDLVQNKDRSRFYTCLSDTGDKLFNMKVLFSYAPVMSLKSAVRVADPDQAPHSADIVCSACLSEYLLACLHESTGRSITITTVLAFVKVFS